MVIGSKTCFSADLSEPASASAIGTSEQPEEHHSLGRNCTTAWALAVMWSRPASQRSF